MSIHVRPTAPLAERALLPADPGVALALAQALLDGPRMFNHNHGLWGYTGQAVDGRDLTIQSTGIGGASAAIVFEELVGLGLGRAVRVGTCGVLRAPDAVLGLGDLLIVEAAVAADGTSRALGSGGLEPADRALTAALSAASARTRLGAVVSTDIFYDCLDAEPSEGRANPRPESARTPADLAGTGPDVARPRPLAVDLESAALFTLGRLRGVPVGCVLVVADLLIDARRTRIDEADLDRASAQAGRLAAGGLGVLPAATGG